MSTMQKTTRSGNLEYKTLQSPADRSRFAELDGDLSFKIKKACRAEESVSISEAVSKNINLGFPDDHPDCRSRSM